MPYVHFSDDLPAEKKDYLNEKISELSKGLFVHGKDRYEIEEMQKDRYALVSRQRAVISRHILSDLNELSKIVLRIYGTHGLSINLSLRYNTYPPISRIEISNDIIKILKKNTGIHSLDEISDFNTIKGWVFQDHFWGKLDKKGLYSQAARNIIDVIIEEHSARFSKNENYFYRIQRAKRDAYTPGDEVKDPKLRKIIPGDIITDSAFWSSATEANSVFYRYSNEGENVTNFGRSIPTDEQEILFMIENNEKLKAIDVSGFKMPKSQEEYSSGEILIKSASLFKVTAIQLHDPRLDRRIVSLEPIETTDIPAGSAIKDSFTGNIR